MGKLGTPSFIKVVNHMSKEWFMGILRFNDGVTFNTDGPLRVVRKRDGYYVVGEGMMCPVDTYEEGRQWVQQMNERKESDSRG